MVARTKVALTFERRILRSAERWMDWFERLTGFPEVSYNDTRARLNVEGTNLRSLANGKSYGIGELEFVSLEDLREQA
jgi:hypothetical protein